MTDETKDFDQQVEKNTGINPTPTLNFYPDLVLPNQKPLGLIPASIYRPQYKKPPTFGETAAAAFREANPVYNAAKLAIGLFRDRLTVEEGFDPIAEGLLDDVPPEYYSTILQYGNRFDASEARKNVLQEIEDKQTLENSGFIARNVSYFGANIADPTNFIPLTVMAKYANVSKGAWMGAIDTAKTMGPFFAIQNAVIYGAKETEGVEEWATQTLIDSFFAASFGGALGAYASRNLIKNTANAKAFFKAMHNDVDIKMQIDKSGKFIKNKAVPIPGSNVSAATVNEIQQILDSGTVSFKDSKTIKNVFGSASPIVRGVTSEFETVQKLVSELYPHTFELAGGNPDLIPNNAAATVVKYWRGLNESVLIDIRQDWMDSLGLSGPFKGTQAAIGSWSGKFQSYEQYSEAVAKSFRRGFIPIDGNEMVAKSAKKIEEKVFKPLLKEIKRIYPDFKETQFTNINNYLMRIYNKSKILTDPEGFINTLVNEFTKTNEKIKVIRQPIDNLNVQLKQTRAYIKELENQAVRPRAKRVSETEKELKKINEQIAAEQTKANSLFGGDSAQKRDYLDRVLNPLTAKAKQLEDVLRKFDTKEIKQFRQELSQAKESRKNIKEQILIEQRKINKMIEDGEVGLDMLDGKPNLTPEQIKQIREINKPISELEAEIKAAKDSKTKAKLKEKLKQEKAKLENKILKGEIPENLYYYTAKGAKLYNPDAMPNLRKVRDKQEILNSAQATRDTILQLNPEQLTAETFDQVISGGNNPFKARTLLVNDAAIENYLVNDIEALSSIYTSKVSKRIYLDDVLKRYGSNATEGMDGINRFLNAEYKAKEAEILKQKPSDARAKELKRLKKSLDDNVKYLGDMYKTYQGTYADRDSGLARTADSVKKLSVWTMLGNVPILMLTEFATPLFNYTFNSYIKDGLVNSVKRLSKFSKSTDSAYSRGLFSDAALCTNRFIGNKFQALMGFGSEYNYTPKTGIEKTIDYLAAFSQNVSGANYIMDFQEFMSASMADTGLMKIILKYNRGEKLLKQEVAKLDAARINPKIWGERIETQFRRYGDTEDIFSNFHAWDDIDAKRQFAIGINTDVRKSILLPDAFSKPLSLQNPVPSLLGQFLSYVFEASNKFTIPALTSPDSTKFIGALSMMAISSMVGPLRQLSRGEEPDLDTGTLINEALTNSALLGWHYELGMKANAYLDLPFLRPLQPDRFKRKSGGALSLGPASGLLDMAYSFTSAVANNEMNESDARKGMRLLFGGTYNWYTAKLFNNALESMELPKNRYEAKRQKELEE